MAEQITSNLSLHRGNNFYRIKMSGEADIDFVNAFSRIVQEVEAHPEMTCLVLDMEEVSYIDSATLSVFIRLIKIYNTDKNKVLLYKPQMAVEEVLQCTNLLSLVTLCRTQAELDEALLETGKKTSRPKKRAAKTKKKKPVSKKKKPVRKKR